MKQALYQVPRNKQIRVIIDTDAYAEGDDPFAIVHALLTPKFDVVGIVAEQFGTRDFPDSMDQSYAEIQRLLNLMAIELRVCQGEPAALADENTPGNSEGARFIVEEALKEDDRPLFVLNMGALTNLASAYLMNPTIAGRLTAIWIGGGSYQGEPLLDFNAGNDLCAANVLLKSDLELWQIPLSAYTMMEVSFHELFAKIQPCGAIGDYLVKNLLRVNEIECAMNFDDWAIARNASKGARTMIIRSGEGWSLGDSPAVGILITSQSKYMETRKAQRIHADGSYGEFFRENRLIRVYHSIDSRVILEDLFAKIRYHFGEFGG
jgi:hypothetical protein